MRAFIFVSSAAILAELGARIRQLRLLANLTQQQLADMSGASLSSIRRFEASGQGSVDLLVRVAQALQVSSQLEPLFVQSTPSIAEVEKSVKLAGRQRARPQAARPIALVKKKAGA